MLVLGWHGMPDLREMDDASGFAAHDSSAVLVRDGTVVAAIEEERLNRVKHTTCFPVHAINYCLQQVGVGLEAVDAISTDWEEEFIDMHIVRQTLEAPGGTVPGHELLHCTQYPSIREYIGMAFRHAFNVDVSHKIRFCKHHLAHLYAAWYPSGFQDALVLCVDGIGDGLSGLVAHCNEAGVKILRYFPPLQSLGNFYARAISALGYARFDEYKVMGLAPYGDPAAFEELFSNSYRLLPEGRFTLSSNAENTSHFLKAGIRGRRRGEPFTQWHKDFAAGLQLALERIAVHVVRHYQQATGARRLCVAGGVAHNCSMNGRLLQLNLFDSVYVQPAAHDAGNSLGSALAISRELGVRPAAGVFPHVFYGTNIGGSEVIGERLARWSPLLEAERVADAPREAARLIAEGAVIGWVQGRSEFGPRALGNRSILADPRPKENKDLINAMVKKREGYRPFAPAVLEERLQEIFELNGPASIAANMTFVLPVRAEMREVLGAVTHVDGTARVQCVIREFNERFHSLIAEFGRLTGVPVVLNTSFNNNCEPIVDSIDDAIVCFLTTDIQYLVIGDWLVRKVSNVRTQPALLDLVPTVPPSYKLVRRARADGSGRPGYALERAASNFFAPVSPLSQTMARVLLASDGEESTRAACARLGQDDTNTLAALTAEIFSLWQARALKFLPPEPARSPS
jgi:carbamoyltransferase